VIWLPDRNDVVLSVTEALRNQGYEVSHSRGKYGVTIELLAKRDKDTFFIEAIGETPSRGGQNLVFAIGKLIMRMKEQGFWFHYGVAMPRNYFKLLKNFEVSGLESLKIHVFLVTSTYLSPNHLDPKETVELIQQLKAGNIINPDLIDIGYP
jgi:hypothetical protein